jgi:hypothetical protein
MLTALDGSDTAALSQALEELAERIRNNPMWRSPRRSGGRCRTPTDRSARRLIGPCCSGPWSIGREANWTADTKGGAPFQCDCPPF